jgi:hypothetical protein
MTSCKLRELTKIREQALELTLTNWALSSAMESINSVCAKSALVSSEVWYHHDVESGATPL